RGDPLEATAAAWGTDDKEWPKINLEGRSTSCESSSNYLVKRLACSLQSQRRPSQPLADTSVQSCPTDSIGTGMSEDMKVNELLPFVTEVVSAQLSNSKTASSDVAPLIQSVYQVLDEIRIKGTPAELPEPAVPIKKSVTPDYIVSLEDGRKFKSLKRYLRTSYDMTPDQYRQRWGLPADYPMVAPNYAKKRSQ